MLFAAQLEGSGNVVDRVHGLNFRFLHGIEARGKSSDCLTCHEIDNGDFCAECHTPRDLLGGLEKDMAYSGSIEGPEGELAPNITPDKNTGVGDWSPVDMTWYLQTGFKPDGDDTQGLMAELIENGYQHINKTDLRAIAAYLRSLPAIDHQVEPKGP